MDCHPWQVAAGWGLMVSALISPMNSLPFLSVPCLSASEGTSAWLLQAVRCWQKAEGTQAGPRLRPTPGVMVPWPGEAQPGSSHPRRTVWQLGCQLYPVPLCGLTVLLLAYLSGCPHLPLCLPFLFLTSGERSEWL